MQNNKVGGSEQRAMEVTYSSSENFFPSYANLCDFDSDEGHRKWREGLKQQVEEDIDRKVKLRLRSDVPFKLRSQRSITFDPLHYRLRRRSNRTATVQNSGNIIVSNISVELPDTSNHSREVKVGSVQSVGISKQAIASKTRHTLSHSSSKNSSSEVHETHTRTKRKTRIGNTGNTKNRLIPGDDKETHEDTAIDHDLRGIYEYVHNKYGVPCSQLQSVAELQSFQTNSIDSSGCGQGPIIYSPIESNICLATPKHYYTESKSRQKQILSHTSSLAHEVVSRDEVTNKLSTSKVKGTLEFESRFESGNLWKASQVGSREYQVWMSPDLYSQKHTQWFYFRVTGMVAEELYKFNVVNFVKPESLYNQGMQPLLYSEKLFENEGQGWTRVGVKVSYSRTAIQSQPLYTLTWTMMFPYSEDTCYLAYCFPYPYSQLLSHLNSIEECPLKSKYLSHEVLCKTLAGNECPLLTITDALDKEKCPAIVISARVHPGETNSSWMMEGLLDFLLSESSIAQELRRNYIFKLIPMLNPDGVIVGNYRTSLAGVDLNRVYKYPDSNLFPTVYHTKKLIDEMMRERKLVLYVDLHGHSRKKNVFTYGCHTPGCSNISLLHEHLLPFLLSKESPTMFDYQSCKFDMQRCKEATGRIVVWKMGVSNSFTLESTFCGSSLNDMKKQFSVQDLKEIGGGLGKAIYNFHYFQHNSKYKKNILSDIAADLLLKISRVNPTTEESVSLKKTHNSSDKIKQKSSVLQRFLDTDMSTLEKESSTSGSDSENDMFTWKSAKRVKRKKLQANHQSRFTSPYACIIQTGPKSTAAKRIKCSTSTSDPPNQLRLPHIKSTPHPQIINEPSSSAPVKLPAVKKFVSKYQDRSNGGIPIFSEERIKERKDKKLLQSDDHVDVRKPSLKPNKCDHLTADTKSLWTMHKTIDLFREAYSTDEKSIGKVSNLFGDKKSTKSTARPLQMEQLKLSADLQKFIKDSWKT